MIKNNFSIKPVRMLLNIGFFLSSLLVFVIIMGLFPMLFLIATPVWIIVLFIQSIKFQSWKYSCTPRNLIISKKWTLYKEELIVPWSSISDVKSSQNLIEKFFGCGSITYEVFGKEAQKMQAIPNHEQVFEVMRDTWEKAKKD